MSELLQGDIMPLKSRGISEETCLKFNYQVGKKNGKWVQIANYYDENGRVCAQHIRFEPKDFIWAGDSKKATLFGQNLWPGGGKRVVVTEGEIDAMTISGGLSILYSAYCLMLPPTPPKKDGVESIAFAKVNAASAVEPRPPRRCQ